MILKCGIVILFFIVVESEAAFFRHDYNCSGVHNYCYKMHRVKKTWQEARKQCTFEGAILASPLNKSLHDMLISVTEQFGLTKYYIGVHATFYPGDWNSVEGIPLTRFSIALMNMGVILDSSEKQCAMMTDPHIIVGTNCYERYPFICYVPNTPIERTMPFKPQGNEEMPCGTVDKGYTLSNTTGKCYKYHKHYMTWSEAYHVCDAESAHLAVIDSGNEAKVIHDIFNKSLGIILSYQVLGHIGVIDWERNGNYYTVTGHLFERSEHFDCPDPEDPATKLYYLQKMYFGSIDFHGKLIITQKESVLPFICEKDPQM